MYVDADAKWLIGWRFNDPSVQIDIKLWPFEVISGPGDKPMIVVNYKGAGGEWVPAWSKTPERAGVNRPC
ncbi:hypothetical protein TIFTF001_031802 [Ficus carica]|uniref:Uncharacterized protein n=1 Tax=Ficus carica TaxID=3494 RepID=A0AA88DVU5_FICCA|nr:hypothetical protein TIFTF001_031802 [Ficus carica]